jgi:hypothetical protein
MSKYKFFKYSLRNPFKKDEVEVLKVVNKRTLPPAGRISQPDFYSDNSMINIGTQYDFVTPSFVRDSIPLIRKLYKVNADVGAIIFDLISLTNTGHSIHFDQTVPPKQVDAMRKHLSRVSKGWGSGVSGIDGLINKMVAQIWVSGALSNEWIPNKTLTGIQNNSLVNPENIEFRYDKINNKYLPYQKLTGTLQIQKSYVKLNDLTYKYFALLNDTDEPFGIPPFLTAMEDIGTQKDMKTNINHILKQLGLLGYLETKVAKPDQQTNESVTQYEARLNKLLTETKNNIQDGFMQGIVVGFEDDHEFEFNSTTKNLGGVSDIFNMNERQIASGLKTSPNFLGLPGGGTETNMGIVFTKMLSQLKSVQHIIGLNLEVGYRLELLMAGFDFKSINIKWNASTITDDLKIQQGLEIKQRVLKALRIDGIISQDKYAEGMGYEKPFSEEPVVPFEDQVGSGGKDGEDKDNDSETKKKSERKGRDKDSKQPRRKDNDTKPR